MLRTLYIFDYMKTPIYGFNSTDPADPDRLYPGLTKYLNSISLYSVGTQAPARTTFNNPNTRLGPDLVIMAKICKKLEYVVIQNEVSIWIERTSSGSVDWNKMAWAELSYPRSERSGLVSPSSFWHGD